MAARDGAIVGRPPPTRQCIGKTDRGTSCARIAGWGHARCWWCAQGLAAQVAALMEASDDRERESSEAGS